MTEEPTELFKKKFKTERVFKNGANWLFGIAVLSLANTWAAFAGAKFHFLAGLAITQVIDAIALHLKAGRSVALGFDTAFAALFVLLGLLARREKMWVFPLSMVLYAGDGLISLFLKDLIGLAFHGLALSGIFHGWMAHKALEELNAPVSPLPRAELFEFKNSRWSFVEFIRARWPTPIYWTLLTLTLGLVVPPFVMMAIKVGGITPAKPLSLREFTIIPMFVGTLVFGLFSLITVIGRLSGYRAFEFRGNPKAGTPQGFASALWLAAIKQGFKPVWKGSGNTFVAVLRPPVAYGEIATASKEAALSLYFDAPAQDGDVLMRVKARSDVIWDSGERVRCETVGKALLEEAQRGAGSTDGGNLR